MPSATPSGETSSPRVPGVRRYAAKAGRTIPVAILRPITRPLGSGAE
jgi:hypothetical protein